MRREEDQQLWDLLGKAPMPVVSPFFARNVLREVRRERSWREAALEWLPRRATSAAAAFAVCLIIAFTMVDKVGMRDSHEDDVPDVVAQIDPSDYEVVADLDVLLAAQEDDSWDDTATL